MFLTHLDNEGHDSPAILIENATAANRAVNIPEFVNIPPDALLKIDAPATDYFRVIDTAAELMKNGQFEQAIGEWKKAMELNPSEALPYNNLGVALAETGKVDDAIAYYRKALELSPRYPEALNNLGEALAGKGKQDEAISYFEKALALDPQHGGAHSNLGAMFARQGRMDQAVPHLEKAVQYKPESVDVRKNLALALAAKGRFAEAIGPLQEAVKLSNERDPAILDLLGRIYADQERFEEALDSARRALAAAMALNNVKLVEALKARLAQYESRFSTAKRDR
jgi:tetratricopeptide (TPR) repeat protein